MRATALDEALCRAAAERFPAWLRTSVAQDEQTGKQFRLRPSSTQRPVLEALVSTDDWLFVVKPRQSHTSTLCLLWALHQIEYGPGRNAVVVADTHTTSEELSSRISTALSMQDPAVQVPTRKEGARLYEFAHRGKIKILSAGSKNTGIGFSVDRMVLSEYGMWADPSRALTKLIPTVAKRPHARVIIETTPGSFGTAAHDLWLQTLAGATRFRAVFIRWWEHEAYTRPVPVGFSPTLDELRMLGKHVGMTHGHLQFRREMLADAFAGDARRFENQYPSDPLEGWTTTLTPALPADDIRGLLPGRKDPPYMHAWEPPQHGHQYLLCADPNSYGTSGDPSAYTLWDATTRTEVAAWSDRVDPAKLGQDLASMARKFNNALLAIESNSAACITAAQNTGYRRLWFNNSNPDHPGWYRTAQAKERATVALVSALQSKQFSVRSAQGLAQLLSWDGVDSRRGGHHWDRLVTYQMAADLFNLAHFPAPVVRPTLPPGHHTVKDMMAALR